MVAANWSSLNSPTVGDTQSDLSVGKNVEGSLEVFTVASDSALWYRKHIPGGLDWGNWTSLGHPLISLNSYTAVAMNKDGRLEVFSTGIDGALWHKWQANPGGDWGNWASLGNPIGVDLVLSNNVHMNDDGRLELFVAGSNNAVWHIWQLSPDGGWSTWKSLGTPPSTNSIGYPVASQNADGRLEVFVIGSDIALWHIWQTTPGGNWGSWVSLGKPSSTNAFSLPFARKNDDGRLEVFTVGTDGALWHIWQSAPNGSWSDWASLGNPPTASVQSPPSVRKNKDGRLEAFNICSDGALWHIGQVTPGGIWGSWESLSMPYDAINLSGGPVVIENIDGRLEAFVSGSDNAFWHTWQVSPGGNWNS